jgi:hypothetical protein
LGGGCNAFVVVVPLFDSRLGVNQKRFAVARDQAPSLDNDEAEALLLENEELRKAAAELLLETALLREILRTHRKITTPEVPDENRRADNGL